jgi:hypothetical protein
VSEPTWAKSSSGWPRLLIKSPKGYRKVMERLCETESTHALLHSVWRAHHDGGVHVDADNRMLMRLLAKFKMIEQTGTKGGWQLTIEGKRAWDECYLHHYGRTTRRSESTRAPESSRQTAELRLDNEHAQAAFDGSPLLQEVFSRALGGVPSTWFKLRLYRSGEQTRRETVVALLQLQAIGLLDERFQPTELARTAARPAAR